MNSRIILGTVQFGIPYGINGLSSLMKEDDVYEIMDYAMENNITTLDTAESYGCAHNRIGNYHRLSNKKFLINTKLKDFRNIDEFDRKIDEMLQELDVEFINNLMIHSSEHCHINSFDEYIRITEDRVKGFGISIYTEADLNHNLLINSKTVQFPFNLLDNYSNRLSLINKLQSNNISIHVRSIFLQGLFFMEKKNFPKHLEPLIKPIEKIEKELNNNQSLTDFALIYPFLFEQIEGVLIGVDSLSQLKTNISILENSYEYTQYLDLVDNIKISSQKLLDPRRW